MKNLLLLTLFSCALQAAAQQDPIYAQYINNPMLINPAYAGSNNMCQWRCRKGHTWTTTVASRVAGTGCGRCARNGRSLFEHEVAELVAAATRRPVHVDVGVEDVRQRAELKWPKLEARAEVEEPVSHAIPVVGALLGNERQIPLDHHAVS